MAKKFLSDIELDAGLVDVNGNTGASGQILSSTGTGVSWVSNVSISEASESVHITVKNTSGATITKGTPVYVTGETGNSGKIEVAPADASDDAKMPALGLLESNLANNAEGFCVQGGLLEGLATETIDGTSTTANDTVYIKAGGGLTMTKPTGTNFIQNIAKVARVHASNGSLVVSSILRTNDVPTPLYIDHANQRVGIGATLPTYRLHVSSSESSGDLLFLHNSNNGAGAAIRFSDNTTSTSQNGTITYRHSDSQSQSGGASFHFIAEPDTTLVLGNSTNKGRFVSYSQNSTSEVDYGFGGNVNTGMYSPSSNQVGLVASGSRKLLVNTDGVTIQNGRLYLGGTVDTNTSSTTALVLNGTEVEKRTLGSAAFSNTGDFVAVTGDTMSGSLDVNADIQANTFTQAATGIPRNNLGSPTVTEMALFDSQFTPKTTLANSYDDLTDLTFWKQDTSSSAWTEVTTYSDDQKRKFLRTANSSVIIPNNTYKFRVEFRAKGYTFANALYGYWSSNSHQTKVHIYKYNQLNSAWTQHTSASTEISSWPGHMYLPFSTIPWHETNTTSSGHYRDVRIEFTPTWVPYSGSGTDYSGNNINIYGLEIWGGYPSGRRTPHYYDQNGKLNTWGDFQVSGNAYAPIVYDSNNTSYSLDPASTSFLNVLNVAGDLSVGGGDITLGGTGRIQGIDTVSAGTDAVNKNYVDNNFASSSHNHDSDYVNVTGDTMTGKLTLSDSGYEIGNEMMVWKRSYTVNNTSPGELLYSDGNSLPNGGIYRFTAHISATGTDQFARAVYWNQDGTWRVNVTGQSGTSSNHPEFQILSNGTSNVPHIHIDHASNYIVHVLGERIGLDENTGTDNAGYGFGVDGFMGSVGNYLYFSPGGTSATGDAPYDNGDKVFHEGYHPNADTWTTARTITIGNTGKSVNGSANVSWSLSEIGAASSSHNHDDRYYTETESDSRFVNVTGDTMTGDLLMDGKAGVGNVIGLASGTLSNAMSLKLYTYNNIDPGGGLGTSTGNMIQADLGSNLVLRQTANDGDITFQSDDGAGGMATYLTLDGSSTDAYFSNPGNVGIGTDSPDSDLHINNDSANPELRLSYSPSSGLGGGGGIRFEGGSSDYVYGNIQWYNGANRDAQLSYAAVGRNMNFQVNERSIETNGYFRFYSGGVKIAEISPLGVYGNVFYDLNNTSYYLNPSSTGNSFNALGYAHIRGGITTDGSARSYTWRALDNTGSSGTRYQKIARITSSQSSRFVIELAGRSTSYADPLLPALGYIVGQLNNDNNYDLVFYNHSGEDTVVDEVGQVDVSTTATDIYIKVSSFSEVTAHGHISDGTIAVESTSAGGTEPTNYVAATNITVWNSRNDGSGSGLDADLLDGNQGTYYLDYNNFTNTPTIPSAYTHPTHPGDDINLDTGALTGATVISDLDFNITTDTLGHVTDANATYSTRNLTASDLGIASTELVKNYQNVNYVASDPTSSGSRTNYGVGVTVYEGYSGGSNRPHTYDATVQFMPASGQGFELSADWVSTTTTPLKIRSLRDCCNGWSPWVDVAVSGTTSSGTFSTTGDYRAPRFYDSNDTSYYLDPASTSELNNVFLDNFIYHRGDTDTYMGFPGADTIRFVTNSAERMEISNGGVVFGGGAAAAKPVHIATADQGTARLRIENTNAGGDTFDLVAGVHNVTQEGFSIYQENANATRLRMDDDGNVKIGSGAPSEKLDVDGSITSNATIWTGYDSGITSSVSCSNWFRSSGGTGWYNATYGGGIYMVDSTWVRVYNNKKFYAEDTIESNSGMYAPIFYDRNNTNYRFNGDASKDGVDLTSSGNYAINVLGTISGGHRKHGNLETPEMQWSVGGSTDLNWKKLCDVVISDASYSGWGAEIEITNFSGNFGNATYNGGELFKGALSIYHWGGTGDTTETAYANIPYEMRNYVRWMKINETGQNRYELQVKSPGNYQQLYVKVKPGIGNQVADIISYANDTNGSTSGTAIASTQSANFNHEFAGGIWTNDSRNIGWKNAYGSPYFATYYGSIMTSTSFYVGSPFSSTTNLYSGYSRANIFYDRSNSAYYMDPSSTGDSIRVAGDVVAYYSSDERLKDNIKPIENALEKVNAISGVTFEWNEKSHKTTGKKDVGVVAQEIEDVLPELVETRANGYKAVDYQKLTAVLIESVKELTAKVEAIEAKQCNCK